MSTRFLRQILTALTICLLANGLQAQESVELAIGQPDAIVDLRTKAGVGIAGTEWRYSDARVVKARFNAPGPKGNDPLPLYPTGKSVLTRDIVPKAGKLDFDDSSWEVLGPTTLEERRGNGLLSFNWYRLKLTVPEKVGKVSTSGSRIVFEVVVDDYAEIWVDGKLNKTFGQSGGSVVKGFNSRNRVILTEDAKPGQVIQVAILGINGPLADIPQNYIWLRSATLDIYKDRPTVPGWEGLGTVVRIDDSINGILEPGVKAKKLAGGFQFTEGPVWHKDGFLLFSDPNTNVIYKYDPSNGNVSVYITKSGYAGVDIGEYHQPGSNGLVFDKAGRLVVCQHGNRQILRHERKGPTTVLASAYDGKKLNSPNDLVYRSDGALYFTDPPYGLPKNFTDPRKETPYQGVYCLINGKLKLVATDLGGPNGIAFSPDERFLYVSNWDIRDIHNTKTIMRYEVKADGTLTNGRKFFDMNTTDDDEALDGLKVDMAGNVYSSAPGGVWIISPSGKYLGKIKTPERPANMAWGGKDGKTLFLTAHSSLYSIRTKIPGFSPFASWAK